jgi:hypothetical protein
MQNQNKSPPVLPQTVWRDRVFAEIDASLAALDWDVDFARTFVGQIFPNCSSRRQLTDDELRQLNRRLDWAVSTLKKPKEKKL